MTARPASADLALLLQSSQEILSSLALPDVLATISRNLLTVVPAWRVGVLLLEADRRYLRLAAGFVRGEDQATFPRGTVVPLDRYPEVVQALECRRAVDIANVGTDERMTLVRERALSAGLRSLHVIPLVARDEVLGALSLGQREGERPLDERERSLSQAFANQAAVAIRNAQLYSALQEAAKQLERKVEERTQKLSESALRLSVVNEITTAINSSLDLERILESSLTNLERLPNVDRAQVYLGWPGVPHFEVSEIDARTGRLASRQQAIPAGPESPSPVALLGLAGSPVEVPLRETSAPPRSHLLAPLVSKEGVVGALQVFSNVHQAYADADLELLQQVAGEISIALERSDLYRAAQLRSKQFEVLSDLGRQLTGALTLENFLPTAAALIRSTFGYSLVTVLRREGERLLVEGVSSPDPDIETRVAQHEQPASAGICGLALTSGAPVPCLDTEGDSRFLPMAGLTTRSELAVPIRVAGEVLGVLDLQSSEPGAFGPNDVAVAAMLADQIAAALQVERLIQAAEQEREFTERILENLTGGLIVTDRRRVVQVINHRGAEMLRLSREELLGRDLLDVLPTAASLFEYSAEQISRDCEVTLSDGTRIPIGFSNGFFVDARNRREALIIAFRDLSEVRALQRTVRHAERLATLGTLAAGVAHEIRNPLFGISATAQILVGEIPEESPLHDLCAAMLDETRRLNDLVTNLLQYGRPQEPRRSPVHPCRLIDDVVSKSRARWEGAGCRVVKACEDDERTVMADADQIKQVLLNLLLNGVEARPGGEIRFDVLWDPAGAWVEMAVSDQGPGLSASEIDRIFDLFYTTKPKGSGMGLAISAKIVEEHGGTIGVTPSDGGGARFAFRLPLTTSRLS